VKVKIEKVRNFNGRKIANNKMKSRVKRVLIIAEATKNIKRKHPKINIADPKGSLQNINPCKIINPPHNNQVGRNEDVSDSGRICSVVFFTSIA